MVGQHSAMSASGPWALDVSTSTVGRPPSGLHSSMDASSSFVRDDPFSNSSKVATVLRGSPSALATTASFHGSGISDLRSAVVSQQRQFDGFVDKVAGLLSAMHTEMTHDLRGAIEGEGSSRMEELRRANAELDGRLVEIGARMADLREAESRDCTVTHLKGEKERAELREWFSREMKVTSGHFMGEVQALYDQVDQGMKTMQQNLSTGLEDAQKQLFRRMEGVATCLDGDMHILRERLHTLEGSTLTQRAIDHACHCLREDLHSELLDGVVSELRSRLVALEEDGAFTELRSRLVSLEERLLGAPGPLAPPLASQEGPLGQRRDRLDRLEAGARQRDAVLERMEDDVRRLQQAEAEVAEREARTAEWQRRAEERLEAAASAEARLALLEQWRKRVEERLERWASSLTQAGAAWPVSLEEGLDCLSRGPKSGPPQPRPKSAAEQRLDMLSERVESLTAMVKQQARELSHGAGAGGQSMETRLDEVAERVETLALNVSKESRHHGHRGQILDDKFEALGSRIAGTEAAVETVKKQLVELRSKQSRAASPSPPCSDGPARALQLQQALTSMAENLRKDLETQVLQAAEGFSRREAERVEDDLRKDLEAQVLQAAEGFSRREAERVEDDLRKDLEASLLRKVEGSSRREVEQVARELRQDLETQVLKAVEGFSRCEAERVEHELRKDLQTQLEARAPRGSPQRDDAELALQGVRKDLEASLLRKLEGSSRREAEQAARELRQDLEASLLRAMEGSSRREAERTAGELREDVKAQLSQALDGFSQREAERAAKDLEGRLELAECAQDVALQPQMEELRRDVEAQLQQVRSSSQRFRDELRREFQERSAQAQQISDPLRKELDARIAQVHSSSQQFTDALRQELVAKIELLDTSSQRLTDDTCRLHHELELRSAHAEGLAQTASELRRDLDALAAQQAAASAEPSEAQLAVRQEEERRLETRLAERLSGGLKEELQAAARADALLGGSASAAAGAGDAFGELAGKVSKQEGDLEELRRQNLALREEVQAFKLERKVSRCLQGLEDHGRGLTSPRSARGAGGSGATAGVPFTPPQAASPQQLRRAVSADAIHTPVSTWVRMQSLRRQEGSRDPHCLSFGEKKQLFQPTSPGSASGGAGGGRQSLGASSG